MNDVMLGVVFILALSSWRFVYKPSLLDKTRDELFDLREEVRDSFLRRGWGLDHPMYAALRDLINGHLHYTESLTVARFAFWVHWHGKNPVEAERLRLRVEALFQTDDEDLAAYIMNVRLRAAGRMVGHMLANSVAGLIVLALVRTAYTVARSKSSRQNMPGGQNSGAPRSTGREPLAEVVDRVSRVTRWSPQTAMEECAIAA